MEVEVRQSPGRGKRVLHKGMVIILLLGFLVFACGLIAWGFLSNRWKSEDIEPPPKSVDTPRKRQEFPVPDHVVLPMPNNIQLETHPVKAIVETPPPQPADDGSHQKLLDAAARTQQTLQETQEILKGIALGLEKKSQQASAAPPKITAPGETADARRKRLKAERLAAEKEAEEKREKMKARKFPAWITPEQSSKAKEDGAFKALKTRWSLTPNTKIPFVTEGKVTNETKGYFLAVVSENVKDSATQTITVLPQGLVIGMEPSGGTIMGDERLAVTAQAMSYRGMYLLQPPGHGIGDREGTAGFADQIDRHHFRMLLSVLLTSVVRLGSSISVGSATAGIGEQLGSNLGQEGSRQGEQEIRQYIRTDPTITIRPAYQGLMFLKAPLELKESLLRD